MLSSSRQALAQISKGKGGKKPSGARALEEEDNEEDGLSEQEDDDFDDEAEDVELYNTICVCQFANQSDKFLINKPSNWYPGSRQEVDNTFK